MYELKPLNHNKREREASEQMPHGGMLCDVMGLGKTLQTLGGYFISLSQATVRKLTPFF
jgi:SNF2-related domain